MIEAVSQVTLIVGVLMIVVMPAFGIVEDFPYVSWDDVLVNVMVGVVFTALGAVLTAITYLALDYVLFEPIKAILGALWR